MDTWDNENGKLEDLRYYFEEDCSLEEEIMDGNKFEDVEDDVFHSLREAYIAITKALNAKVIDMLEY